MFILLLTAVISYLIGSIPTALLLSKYYRNIDIRKIGSGNIGATNALRTGNKIIGYSTLALDILKAVITILFIKFKVANVDSGVYFLSLLSFISL